MHSKEFKIQCSELKRKCHFVMLGSLITSLSHNDLWPLPDWDNYKGSVHKLLTQISKLSLENAKGIIVDPTPIKLFGFLATGQNTGGSYPCTSSSGSGDPRPFGIFPSGFDPASSNSSTSNLSWNAPLNGNNPRGVAT